jgi:BCD family chlorophyll transporter-like MFS transporter
MLVKRLQLGLIHVAVAMTLVPINSTLNRVMIKELAFSATLVAVLASLPYLFSPIQVAIGSFSDRHPLFGLRRTPYIALGLVLCVLGVILAPQAAFVMAQNFRLGVFLSVITFGAWGMGFNFATVSYFSLASEISGEKGRSRTVAIMFFMMIASIIATAIGLSRLLENYSPAVLLSAFRSVALAALVLGSIGLVGLEKRSTKAEMSDEVRHSLPRLVGTLVANSQALRFFLYLILMLAAILGQDVLLEPFAAEAFGLPVNVTTRITSIWGTCVLLFLLVAGFLEGRVSKRGIVKVGALGAMLAFLIIAASGLVANKGLFYSGVVLLGLATGLATVSNLSLMLDMTTAQNVGLFIGAWGMADALARLTGSVLSGAVRDLVTQAASGGVSGYIVVFTIEAAMLLVSLLVLRRIDVSAFRRQAEEPSLVERAALASEA